MRIDRSYISDKNTYAENDPRCIVVHNTDNFAAGATALAHARAQYNGNFANMSAHYYTDDGDIAYQAAPHSRGCWHVGVNYGGNNLFGRYGNRSSIGVEMCVQKGYNYEKAFQNTVAVVKEIMRETGIPASRVYRHYDICSKNCPSQIIAKGDWTRFKKLISSGSSDSSGNGNTSGEEIYKPGVYKVNDTELNIRIAPNADSKIVGVIRDQGSYTITKIQNGSWGKLLSGAGWINCHRKYCTYGGTASVQKPAAKAISVDGVWGHELTKRLQEIFKTGVDGVISDQPTVNKEYCAGIAAAEWSDELSGGSDLIRAMQKWAGTTEDGYIGPQTICALQKKLGTPVDGVISYPSAMVKALQEWCNRQ